MECSIKAQKVQEMKNKYKKAQFIYNLVLYSLSFCITCLFFSHPFWYPSMKQFLFSLPNNISLFFNAKCFFLLGNIIVLFLVGESKLTRSSHPSLASEIYDEYVARNRRSFANPNSKIHVNVKADEGFVMQSFNLEKKIIIEDKVKNHEEKKKESIRVSENIMDYHREERKTDMRTNYGNEEIKKESINVSKTIVDHNREEKRTDMRMNCENEEKKMELSVSKSMHHEDGEKKNNGMRKCKSEVWGENEIMKRKRSRGRKEDRLCIQKEELNKRVEAFIARVNKQRLLEAKISN